MMWKKVLLSISLIVVLIIGVELFYYFKDKRNDDENLNIVEEKQELLGKYITDECINEWNDYAVSVQEDLKVVNESLNDENRYYIIKEKDNFINVYYINENKEEVLYRVTEIGTEYLPKEDIQKLQDGIEVIGLQNLNLLLEDFE